jgi:putative intracellular protease/amidase
MDRTNGLEQTASTSLSVNVFTALGKAMVGDRPKPFGEALGFNPITSTLIFGEHDAALVDAIGTVAEAEALADWVALHNRNLSNTVAIQVPLMKQWGAEARVLVPTSKRSTTMTTKGKVLVLVSSGHGLPLKDGKVYTGAGYYLNELTVPVRALMKEGYEITFANPKGNTPQMDVHSAVADFFGGDEAKLQDYLKFRDTLTGLESPTRISDVIASGLDQYDAVFVPGGHGPMMDLLDDPDAGTVLRHFHKTSKPTAVLCHGPISLLSALPNSKEVVDALAAGDTAGARAKAQGWIYSGYKMTIFSTAEEQQREPLEIGGKVLFYPDFALRTAGGDVSVVEPWKSHVLQDRELISGQNPFSDQALLNLLLPALEGKKKRVA